MHWRISTRTRHCSDHGQRCEAGSEAAAGGQRDAHREYRIWRVAFSVPTLTGLFHVTLHVRVSNWRFFEQTAGRRIHSLVHKYSNKRDSSWQNALSQEDRNALVVHNVLVFKRSFQLMPLTERPSSVLRRNMPRTVARVSCAVTSKCDVLAVASGWQPPACNLRRFLPNLAGIRALTLSPRTPRLYSSRTRTVSTRRPS